MHLRIEKIIGFGKRRDGSVRSAKLGKQSLHAYRATQLHTAGVSLFHGSSLRRMLVARWQIIFIQITLEYSPIYIELTYTTQIFYFFYFTQKDFLFSFEIFFFLHIDNLHVYVNTSICGHNEYVLAW